VEGVVGLESVGVKEGVDTARSNFERNLSGVGINVKIFCSVLYGGGVGAVEVPEFVGIVGSCGGSCVFEENGKIWAVWKEDIQSGGVGGVVGELSKITAVSSVSDPVNGVGIIVRVKARAEFTVKYPVSSNSSARLDVVVEVKNGCWSSKGSCTDIYDGILEDTIFNPNSEELAAAKRLTPCKRQGVRIGEIGGQIERSSKSACTNSEAGNVSCEVSSKVSNVDGISNLCITKITNIEVGVDVITELESWRSSSTINEWDLVGVEVSSISGVVNNETDGVVIYVGDNFWCEDRSSVVLGSGKSLIVQLSVEEGPVVGR
jgi:hypothetical protein